MINLNPRDVFYPALFALVVLLLPVPATAQDVHPRKKIFENVKDWPATAPGEVALKNFSPFRAVYDRTYRQASGPDAGAARQDRVIISAEETGWDGRRAVAVTLVDSGIVEHADTNARVLTMFVSLDDLSVLFEIGPIPGTAKDYFIARFEKNEIFLNQVTTDTQKLVPQKLATGKPGFGPNAWVMASMNLSKGLKIILSPAYSPRGNPLTFASYGHIIGKGTFTDGSGRKHEAWILETSGNLATPRVSHVYLKDRPPYYLGTETVDLETGERTKFVWLRKVQMLD